MSKRPVRFRALAGLSACVLLVWVCAALAPPVRGSPGVDRQPEGEVCSAGGDAQADGHVLAPAHPAGDQAEPAGDEPAPDDAGEPPGRSPADAADSPHDPAAAPGMPAAGDEAAYEPTGGGPDGERSGSSSPAEEGQPGAQPDPDSGGVPLAEFWRACPDAQEPLWYVDRSRSEVVLTFDDGPSRFTEPILDILRAEGVPAVFFWLGRGAARETLLKVAPVAVRDGHQIGSHTLTHSRLPQIADAALKEEIGESQRLLGDASGQVVRYLRPPYGEWDSRVRQAAACFDQRLVLWSVDSRDWALADDPDRIIANVMSGVRPGSIILLHERQQTLDILPMLIAELRAAGYGFRLLP